MIGTIGFLFWSAVVLAPALFAAAIAGRLLRPNCFSWLAPAAVAGGFLSGGVVGWASVPAKWNTSLWKAIDAAGSAAKYGHSFEHAAEQSLMYFFYFAVLGELAFGITALLVGLGAPTLCATVNVINSRGSDVTRCL